MPLLAAIGAYLALTAIVLAFLRLRHNTSEEDDL